MQNRCARNRKRSKRRAIYCPKHLCYMDSVSPKYRLYTDCTAQLQQRGVGRRAALLLIATQTTVTLDGEWLEKFWCPVCQESHWYHVNKTGERSYQLSLAPQELWQQVQGVIDPRGNPSVGEFTYTQARMANIHGIKQYRYVN
jgi:hypothetical protein